jgi:hypothetical protein
MRYRLERLDELTQSIWDEIDRKRVIMFSEKDYGGEFMLNHPYLIVDILNGKKFGKHNSLLAVRGLLALCEKISEKHAEMMETIEGLKEGGKCLNYILPPPVEDMRDCLTTSDLYRLQYKMARQKWDAYFKRFYEKRPGKNDEIVARTHRSDLHHMRYSDGKWFFKCTINNVTTKKFLGTDEEKCKLLRDKYLKELGYHG